MTMNLNEFKAKIKQVIDNIKFENLQESFSVRNLSKSSISDQNFVDLNNSFVTVNELFGKENKKVNANNSTHNKSLNYIECF